MTTMLMLSLAALAIVLPAPRTISALDGQQPMGLGAGFTETSWTSDSLSELMMRGRLESREFGTLTFAPAPKSI
ncbi:MAG: hypothetical protein ABL866_03115 [Devosia sp.]